MSAVRSRPAARDSASAARTSFSSSIAIRIWKAIRSVAWPWVRGWLVIGFSVHLGHRRSGGAG
ncbi:hypothetical protein HNR21_004773 [Actinomadura cellulosilytica]|uniref:Uncharacterized protein n=1 Tax=Thermomonospora cellulosilytica TaxID=1411118 RepID=A0A7W3N1N1_9ACTN|nr:hypothetical protein [Thermomonospora cellulosilytica]